MLNEAWVAHHNMSCIYYRVVAVGLTNDEGLGLNVDYMFGENRVKKLIESVTLDKWKVFRNKTTNL